MGATESGAFGEVWSKRVTSGYQQVGGERCDSVNRKYRRGGKLWGRGMVDRFSFRQVVCKVHFE